MQVFRLILAVLLVSFHSLAAQIPVEVFSGNRKTSLDLMFFRYFKNKSGQNGKFLFFSRERAIVDYRQTPKENLPQFGFTEALSLNLLRLKGLAPVAVCQILNNGIYPKAGLQFVHLSKNVTAFGWMVAETRAQPTTDIFFLLRYTPEIKKNWQVFTQIELLNALPSNPAKYFSFIQRLRLGLKKSGWQWGVGSDILESGRGTLSITVNSGIFLRHEF